MFPPAPSPYLQCLPELLSAKRKLAEVASYFDASKISFRDFSTRKLDALEFKNRLWQIFYVALTDAELGAIITLFDHDGSHKIDLLEFIRAFFKFGDVQKKSFVSDSLEHREKLQGRIQKTVSERQARIAPLKEIEYAEKWTQEDDERVMQKMALAAFTFDQRLCAVELQDFFRVDSFSPAEFKEKVKRSFNVKLSNNELFALINRFSGRFHGRVDAKLFFDNFFKQRREVQSVEFFKHEKVFKRKEDQIKRLIKNVIERFGQERVARVSTATGADVESACIKLKRAAGHTKPLLFGSIRDYFEASKLTPTQFRDFLRDVYYVDLTAGELDAAMKMFDIDMDGTISYGEFTSTFYEMGLEERSKINMQQKATEQKRAQKKKEAIQKRHEKYLKSIEPKIKWPVIPDEDDDDDDFVGDDGSADVSAKDEIFLTTEQGDGSGEGDSKGGSKKKSAAAAGGLLPPLSDNASLGTNSLAQSLSNASSENMLRSRSMSAMDKSGRIRKAPTEEYLKPNPLLQRLVATNTSFTVLFPKISQDTRDFLCTLEDKERALRKLDKRSKSLKRANKMKQRRRRSKAANDDEQANADGLAGKLKAGLHGKVGGDDGEEEEDNYEFDGGGEGGDDPNNVEYEMELDEHWKFDPIFETVPSQSEEEQQQQQHRAHVEPSPSSSGGHGKIVLRSPLASPSAAAQRLSSAGGGVRSRLGSGSVRPDSRSDSRGQMARPDSRSDSRGGVGSSQESHRLGSSGLPQNATGLTGFRAPRRDHSGSGLFSPGSGVGIAATAAAATADAGSGGNGDDDYAADDYEEEYEDDEDDVNKEGPPIIIS